MDVGAFVGDDVAAVGLEDAVFASGDRRGECASFRVDIVGEFVSE